MQTVAAVVDMTQPDELQGWTYYVTVQKEGGSDGDDIFCTAAFLRLMA